MLESKPQGMPLHFPQSIKLDSLVSADLSRTPPIHRPSSLLLRDILLNEMKGMFLFFRRMMAMKHSPFLPLLEELTNFQYRTHFM